MVRLLSTIMALLLLISCDDGSFVSTPRKGWGRNDTLVVAIPKRVLSLKNDDTMTFLPNDTICKALLVVRFDRTYPNRELRFRVNNHRFRLSVDARRGVSLFEVATPFAITAEDSVLHVTHLMWQEPLHGVVNVGLIPDI